MSILISWISPEELIPIDQISTVTKVNIYRSLSSSGPFGIIKTIDALDPVTGKFIIQFEDITGFDNFYYQVSFLNANGQESKRTDPGTGGFLSRIQSFVEDVRFRLYDFDETLYRLDDEKFMWMTTQLYSFANQALNKINQTGPMLTNYTMENVVPTELLKDYMVYLCLKSRAIIENFNQFNFNDGQSLTWDRSSRLFSASDGSYASLIKEIRDFKLAHRPKSRAIGSQRLPFKILRPLSFLPNASRTFGF